MKLWFSLIEFTCEKAACELRSRSLTGLESKRWTANFGLTWRCFPTLGPTMYPHCFVATQSPLVAPR